MVDTLGLGARRFSEVLKTPSLLGAVREVLALALHMTFQESGAPNMDPRQQDPSEYIDKYRYMYIHTYL